MPSTARTRSSVAERRHSVAADEGHHRRHGLGAVEHLGARSSPAQPAAARTAQSRRRRTAPGRSRSGRLASPGDGVEGHSGAMHGSCRRGSASIIRASTSGATADAALVEPSRTGQHGQESGALRIAPLDHGIAGSRRRCGPGLAASGGDRAGLVGRLHQDVGAGRDPSVPLPPAAQAGAGRISAESVAPRTWSPTPWTTITGPRRVPAETQSKDRRRRQV